MELPVTAVWVSIRPWSSLRHEGWFPSDYRLCGNYGKPIINKESGYTERGFSAAKDIRKTKYNLYRNCPGATVDSVGADGCTYNQVAASGTYNMYVGREPRFYLTVMWNRQWYHQAEREVQMMSNEQDGGPTHDAPQNGYLNRKKVSLDQNQRNGIHPYRPGILYRLGEAYLNYAEALNECDPGNPDILKYLNLFVNVPVCRSMEPERIVMALIKFH